MGLRPLNNGNVDQLRIWINDPMSGKVAGYLVIRGNLTRCRLATKNMGDGIVVKRGSCEAKRPNGRTSRVLLAALDDLAGLDGMKIVCPIVDGWEMEVVGVCAGKTFHFHGGNVDQCDEPLANRAAVIAGALRELKP